jgi:BirA family biotin operon repressor/biotin-[acetyl-CoA-carboxylase] ligase
MYKIDFLEKRVEEFGFELIYVPEVDSTMRIVEKEAHMGVKNRVVVLAEHQTGGVGRSGRVWVDRSQSSILVSILMKIPQSSVATFADLVALSICNSLRKVTGLTDIKIKYPNDIVFLGKKLGGILVKNVYDDKLNYLGTNIGIGLNIHYTEEMLRDFKTDYAATALDICMGSHVNRQDLLVQILEDLKYLDAEIESVEANPKHKEKYDILWRNASSMLGKKISILRNDSVMVTGLVNDTALGKGIELYTDNEKQWFSFFGTDMKARVIN